MKTFQKLAIIFTFILIQACRNDKNSSSKAIIGSDDRSFHESSKVGILVQTNEGDVLDKCVAFAVSDDSAFTAGHCISNDPKLKFSVRFGSNNLNVEKFEINRKSDTAKLFLGSKVPSEYVLPLASNSSSQSYKLLSYDFLKRSFFDSAKGSIESAELFSKDLKGLIFHTLDSQPGSSGSPIVNEKGEVIAVHLASINRGPSAYQNLAVEFSQIATADINAISNGKVVPELTEELQKTWNAIKTVFPEASKMLEQIYVETVPASTRVAMAKIAGQAAAVQEVGNWFERNPVYGDKYKVVEDPLYSRLGSSVLTYVGFHLGNGNFSQDSRCAGPIASSGLISQKLAYFFVNFNPLNGNEAFKPYKFKIRFVGLCGVESPATVKVLERNGQDTLREMGTFTIGTDFETAGTATIQAQTYSSEIAILKWHYFSGHSRC